MKLIIYTGSFQYGVISKFISLVGSAFKKKGVTVIYVDINSKDYLEKLIDIFSHQVIDCVIGFGGIGSEIQIENESIYDIVKTNYLAIQVDHPSHHIGRIVLGIKNYMISFVDKSHVDYIDEILPNHHIVKFFLPHGGIQSEHNILNSLETYNNTKCIDILFCASYLGNPKKEWQDQNYFPSELIDKVVDLLLEDEYISIHEAFSTILNNEKISLSTLSKLQCTNLLASITWYVRRYKRLTIVTKLLESGLNITLCGSGWENIVSKYKNVDYRGALNIEETMKLMQQSKITLNVNPYFTQGGHERVFTAMLNGSVVFSDRSTFYEQYYQENQDILYYSLQSIDEDIKKLQNILPNKELLYSISKNAYEITNKNHLWEHRANQILKMIAFTNNIKG